MGFSQVLVSLQHPLLALLVPVVGSQLIQELVDDEGRVSGDYNVAGVDEAIAANIVSDFDVCEEVSEHEQVVPND